MCGVYWLESSLQWPSRSGFPSYSAHCVIRTSDSTCRGMRHMDVEGRAWSGSIIYKGLQEVCSFGDLVLKASRFPFNPTQSTHSPIHYACLLLPHPFSVSAEDGWVAPRASHILSLGSDLHPSLFTPFTHSIYESFEESTKFINSSTVH